MATSNTGPDPALRTEPMPLEGHALPLPLWEKVCADAGTFLADDVSDQSETEFEECDYNTEEDMGLWFLQ